MVPTLPMTAIISMNGLSVLTGIECRWNFPWRNFFVSSSGSKFAIPQGTSPST